MALRSILRTTAERAAQGTTPNLRDYCAECQTGAKGAPMCNLYRMRQSVAEVAALFRVNEGSDTNAGGMVYPGYPGVVVTDTVQTMTWGFPLTLRSKRTGEPLKPKPVNNARTDKLDSRMWSASFRERRCLIPVNAFAEAEGTKGAKTRTWFTLPDQETCACAGIWRDSAEWGPVYSMIMTDANDTVAPVHNRMPVILHRDHWADWRTLPVPAAKALCVPYGGAMAVERTEDRWTR